MKRFIVFIIVSMLVITAGADTYARRSKAPRFALYNMNDKIVMLSRLIKEGNVLLAFWASYCKPCIKEMPHLVELEKSYGTKRKIKLVLINIDKEKESAVSVLEQLNVKSECLLDLHQVTIKKYVSKPEVPALFLVNRRGNIVFKAIGSKKENLDRLEAAIKRLR